LSYSSVITGNLLIIRYENLHFQTEERNQQETKYVQLMQLNPLCQPFLEQLKMCNKLSFCACSVTTRNLGQSPSWVRPVL